MMDILGIKYIDFTGKDGRHVSGVKVFVSDPAVRVDAGIGTDALYLSDDLLFDNGLSPADFHVGDGLNISYNKFGKIRSVTVS